jgi:polar amino acid transport system substrate-binding protein
MKHLLLILLMTIPAISHAKSVSMTSNPWSPFYGPELEDDGFISVIVRESFSAAGYDSELKFTEWTEALTAVERGDLDVLMGAYYSEEREKLYHYSLPIHSLLTGAIALNTLALDFYSSYEVLNNYKLGKIDQSVVSKHFDSYPFDSMTGYKGVEEGVAALLKGDIDLYVDSFEVVKQAVNNAGHDARTLKMLNPPVEQNDLFILVSKNIPNALKIRDDFNKGFITIQQNGTYENILKRFTL